MGPAPSRTPASRTSDTASAPLTAAASQSPSRYCASPRWPRTRIRPCTDIGGAPCRPTAASVAAAPGASSAHRARIPDIALASSTAAGSGPARRRASSRSASACRPCTASPRTCTNRASAATSVGGSGVRCARQPGRGPGVALDQRHQREVGRGRGAAAGVAVGGVQRGRQRLPRRVEPARQRLEPAEDVVEPGCRRAGAQVGFGAQRAGELTTREHRADGEDEAGGPVLRCTAQVRRRHEAVRRLRPAAGADLVAAQGGELGGEVGVRPDGRGDPVVHPGGARRAARRPPGAGRAGGRAGGRRRPRPGPARAGRRRGARCPSAPRRAAPRGPPRPARAGARAASASATTSDSVERVPSTAAATTRSCAGRDSLATRTSTSAANERGAGRIREVSASASAGSSVSSAAACSGWPSVWSRRRRPASGVRAGPPSAPDERDDLLGVETPAAGRDAPGGPGSGRAPTRPTRARCRRAPRPRRGPGRGAAVGRRTRAPAPVASSTHWASSTTTTTGPADCSAPSTVSSSAPTASGSASGAGPGGEQRAEQPAGHVGDELAQHPERRARSRPPRRRPAGRRRRRWSSSRRRTSDVFPMPAGPLSHRTRGCPVRTRSSSAAHRRELADPADERAVPGHARQSVAAGQQGNRRHRAEG